MEKSYELPNRYVITIGSERFRTLEALFYLSLLGCESNIIHTPIYNSIMKCDSDVRMQLWGNIVMVSATSCNLAHADAGQLYRVKQSLNSASEMIHRLEALDGERLAEITSIQPRNSFFCDLSHAVLAGSCRDPYSLISTTGTGAYEPSFHLYSFCDKFISVSGNLEEGSAGQLRPAKEVRHKGRIAPRNIILV